MNRRLVLKQMAMATAAALILPSCVSDPKKVSIALKNLQVDGDEEDLIANIADTLIPATKTPGAKGVDAHLFTFIMVDDCMSKDDQQKYLKGMRAFDDATRKVTGKSFIDASEKERENVLITLEANLDKLPEDVKIFYNTTRHFIVQGYLSSQHFLTDIKPYQLVPGPNFKGCVPVNEVKNL